MHSSVTHILLKDKQNRDDKLPEDGTKGLGDHMRWQHGWISPADEIWGTITIDQRSIWTVLESSQASIIFIIVNSMIYLIVH